MEIVKGVDNIDVEQWNNLIKSNKDATPFQTHEYSVFLSSLEDFKYEVYGVIGIDYELNGICVVAIQAERGIKSYFSRRGIIYGGPVIKDNNLDVLNHLLRYIEVDLTNKVIYIETRNFNDQTKYINSYKFNAWEYLPYTNILINLENTNMSEILSSMKSNRRREILYSEKEGASTTIITDENDLTKLYNILHQLYQEVVKLPLPTFDYFLNLMRSKIGIIFGVYHQDKLIGGAFCVYYPHKSIYTQYYCGIRDYHKRIFATHLAIKAAIDFGLKNKLNNVDLMGAGLKDDIYGVRNYKKQFGGFLVEHGRFLKILDPVLYNIGKTALSILKKIN